MSRYAVPSRTNQKLFRVCAYGSIGLMLVCLALSRLDLDDRASHMIGWVSEGLLALGMLGVIVLVYRDSFDKLWQKMTFDLTDEKIVRMMEGQPPIEFPLNKINFLGESRLGLIVRSGEPSRRFLIPRGVNDFEQLKQRLSGHCAVTPSDGTSLALMLPVTLAIALYAFLFTIRSRIAVCIAGVAALLLQGWAIFWLRKIWAKTKWPKLVMSVFLFSWLVLLWLVCQRVYSTP
jgi:hypothetical protein